MVLLLVFACAPSSDGLVVPPMTPSLSGIRPTPLTLSPTPDPCERSVAAGQSLRAEAVQGAYEGQTIPADWAEYDQAALTQAFLERESQPDWVCVAKAFPKAVAIFLAIKGPNRLAPPRATPTLPPER